VFRWFRAPRLRITFEHTQPWCRTEAHGELWVRVAVANVGRSPAHGWVGRITPPRRPQRNSRAVQILRLGHPAALPGQLLAPQGGGKAVSAVCGC